MGLLDILFGRKGIGRPLRERPKSRSRLEGRGEKPDTPKPDIDEGKWEEEFEYKLYNNGIQINESIFFKDLVIKYLGTLYNVKIKVRKGYIQIERMK